MFSQPQMNRRLLSLLPGLVAASLVCHLSTSASITAAEEPPEKDVRLQANEIAQSIQIKTAGEKQADLELVDEPVLRFGDIARDNVNGSIWLWVHDGRPQAVLELYRPVNESRWVHVFQSLSQQPLTGAIGQNSPTWAPTDAGIAWKPLPEAPKPSPIPAVRSRQLKDLAQRFTAHEFWDPNNSRFELRLLVRPVHKYLAPEEGIADGAVFLLCHETNPEVILLIEATQAAEKAAEFRYALARLGHAEMHVEYQEHEVWTQPRVATTSVREPYFLLFK